MQGACLNALDPSPRLYCLTTRRYDSTDILNKLRAEHHKGGKWFGVDVENEGICDTYESFVWEPLLVKRNAISAATEAACLILSVDETVMKDPHTLLGLIEKNIRSCYVDAASTSPPEPTLVP